MTWTPYPTSPRLHPTWLGLQNFCLAPRPCLHHPPPNSLAPSLPRAAEFNLLPPCFQTRTRQSTTRPPWRSFGSVWPSAPWESRCPHKGPSRPPSRRYPLRPATQPLPRPAHAAPHFIHVLGGSSGHRDESGEPHIQGWGDSLHEPSGHPHVPGQRHGSLKTGLEMLAGERKGGGLGWETTEGSGWRKEAQTGGALGPSPA